MSPSFTGFERSQDAGRAKLSLYGRVGPMFVRGVFRRMLFGTRQGTLFVGRRVRISNSGQIHLGGRLVLEDNVELQGLSRNGVRFGSSVSIGANTMIRPSSYYGGEIGEGLTVGDRSSIAAGCFIGCSGTITIGNDVMVGPMVKLFSENHITASTDETIKSQGVSRSFLIIEDDCWIGAGSTITAGVTVGRGSVIGAGSVVTRDVAPYSVVAGVPARLIRSRQFGRDLESVDRRGPLLGPPASSSRDEEGR
jgi:acetyltransferase-like isoleucine patch superfamily enzyme